MEEDLLNFNNNITCKTTSEKPINQKRRSDDETTDFSTWV